MKSSPFALVLMVALAARSAAADAFDERVRAEASPWVGGMGVTATLGSHGVGVGANAVARYAFVQVGLMGFTASRGAAGFGTFGLVGTVENLDLALVGMIGSQTIDHGALLNFDKCKREGSEVTATTAGVMLSMSRSLRAGGTWIGGGGWVGSPLRTTRHTVTSTCTSGSWFSDTSTSTSAETVGASGGLFFRIGFGIL